MASAVNAGARLDRLPISSFHYRIFWLVGAGMFFDGYDLYVAGGVLAVRYPDQVLDAAAEPAIPLLDLRRHDDWFADHRLRRRPLRPAFHLSDQSADFRPGLARRRLRAGHDPAHHLPLRAGAGLGRRNRGRLFDADRIRAAEDARPLAGLHGVPGGGGIPGHRAAQLSDHSELRLAADVRHRRHRLADRLVSAQEPAGIPALAGIARPQRGSGSLDAIDREGSRPEPVRCRRRPSRLRFRSSPHRPCCGRRSCNA